MLTEIRTSIPVLRTVREKVASLINVPDPKPEDLESLLAIGKPVEASLFVGRRYMAFRRSVVDSIMRYYLNILGTWDALAEMRKLTTDRPRNVGMFSTQDRRRLTTLLTLMKEHLSAAELHQSILVSELESVAELPEKEVHTAP
jgi:hypothetical protein